jgi:hypothetical protein
LTIDKLENVEGMLSKDENCNMTLTGTVGYGEGQKGTAESFIGKVNGTHKVTSENGASISLTVNLSLTADGSGGDFRVLSLGQLSTAVGQSRRQLIGRDGRSGPCVIACAAPERGYLYFERMTAGTAMHEMFHLMGFEHQTWGIMRESEYATAEYRDFHDLRSTYFGH